MSEVFGLERRSRAAGFYDGQPVEARDGEPFFLQFGGGVVAKDYRDPAIHSGPVPQGSPMAAWV
jgi:hypothetical protein